MLLRLTPALGGDGIVFGIIAMNDTGSDILTLFRSDLTQLFPKCKSGIFYIHIPHLPCTNLTYSAVLLQYRHRYHHHCCYAVQKLLHFQ